MKIVDRKTFLQLPANTLFQKYAPCVFGDLEIKVCNPIDNWGNDFVTQSLTEPCFKDNLGSDKHFEALLKLEEGAEFRLDYDFAGRDGLYDKDQLFAVYDKEDVQKLMDRLKECL